jgi:hypothetical protein
MIMLPTAERFSAMTDYGTLAAPMVKTAPQPKNGRPREKRTGR